MGTEGISKSQVSRLGGEIDERVRTFLSRPIEGEWPYVWLDATCVKTARPPHRLGRGHRPCGLTWASRSSCRSRRAVRPCRRFQQSGAALVLEPVALALDADDGRMMK